MPTAYEFETAIGARRMGICFPGRFPSSSTALASTAFYSINRSTFNRSLFATMQQDPVFLQTVSGAGNDLITGALFVKICLRYEQPRLTKLLGIFRES